MSTSACYTVSATYEDVHRSGRPDLSLVYRMNRHLVRIFGDIRVTDLARKKGVPAKKETMKNVDPGFADLSRTEPERSPTQAPHFTPLGAWFPRG